jgi:carbonic anhydrase
MKCVKGPSQLGREWQSESLFHLIDILRRSSTLISGPVKENKLKVVAAYYDVATGTVSLLE